MKKRNTVTARLRGRAGESIGEVLAALLISAIALMMLASMVASSSNLVMKSEQAIEAYIAAQNELAVQGGVGAEGTVTVTSGENAIELYDGAGTSIQVIYYENNTVAGDPVIAYRVK